jgi:hypothetical protein
LTRQGKIEFRKGKILESNLSFSALPTPKLGIHRSWISSILQRDYFNTCNLLLATMVGINKDPFLQLLPENKKIVL